MVFAGGAAKAQTVTIDVTSSMDLGKVIAAATGTTTFRVSTAGAVSVVSGTGSRMTSGTVATPSVTVKCTNGSGTSHQCTSNYVYINVGGSARTGSVSAAPNNFTLSSGSAYASTSTTNTFRVGPLSNGVSTTYKLGMDIPISNSATVGAGTYTFGAAAGFTASASSPNDVGSGSLTSVKPLSVTKTSDLAFGRVVKPASGSSTVTITTAGARTITGTGVIISSTFAPAAYAVTGQASQSVSISAPAFDMTNTDGDTLAVTPIIPTGLTAIGTGGTYAFSVGGAFTMTSTTDTGFYTGNFSVSVAYN